MSKPFENPNAEKVEDETTSDATPQKIVERIADKFAEKTDKAAHEGEKNESDFPI